MAARILIVEDHPDIVNLMHYLLCSAKHTVLAVADGSEALAVANREPLDLVICDIQMPNIDGYEVARQFQANARLAAIPLVAITALDDARDKILGAGFVGYLTKPIQPRTFVRQIESFLVGRADQQQLDDNLELTNSGSKVLIVDNSPIDVELTQRILQPFGFEVRGAATIQEALAFAKDSPPDIILADLDQSLQAGCEIIRAVRFDPARQRIALILMASANVEERDREQCLALEAEKILVRPIAPKQLVAEIRDCLSNRGGA